MILHYEFIVNAFLIIFLFFLKKFLLYNLYYNCTVYIVKKDRTLPILSSHKTTALFCIYDYQNRTYKRSQEPTQGNGALSGYSRLYRPRTLCRFVVSGKNQRLPYRAYYTTFPTDIPPSVGSYII